MSAEGSASPNRAGLSRLSGDEGQDKRRVFQTVEYPNRTLWQWQLNHSGALRPRLQTPPRFRDSSMLVDGSSGRLLAMFPEGSFCRRTGRDDGTGQSLRGHLDRSQIDPLSKEAAGRDFIVFEQLLDNLEKVNAGQVNGPRIPITEQGLETGHYGCQ
jgi:hypothetical protein